MKNLRTIALILLLPLLPSFVSHAAQMGAPAKTTPEMSIEDGRKAIEQFMSETALWMIEMEWSFGYDNKTPSENDREKIMLAADITKCPADFQEAWRLQIKDPRRNYSAPMFRKYGVDLSVLRKKLQKELADIDSSISPPIPLYNDEEKAPKYDPTRCGSQKAILEGVAKLRAKLNGIDPSKALQWQKAINNAMLEYMLCYMEMAVCVNVSEVSMAEVTGMLKKIDVSKCPPDFVAAWNNELKAFDKEDEMDEKGGRVSTVCRRYGVNDSDLLGYVKAKMNEWRLQMPSKETLPEFRAKFAEMKKNLLDYR